MLWTTIFKSIIEPKTRKEESSSETNNEVDDNNNKSLYGSIQTRKNTFFGREFVIHKTKLAFTRLR